MPGWGPGSAGAARRRQRQVLAKGGQRRDTVVDGFGRGANGGQNIAVRLDVGHRDGQKRVRLLRPQNPAMADEGQDPVPVGAAGVNAIGAVSFFLYRALAQVWCNPPDAKRSYRAESKAVS